MPTQELVGDQQPRAAGAQLGIAPGRAARRAPLPVEDPLCRWESEGGTVGHQAPRVERAGVGPRDGPAALPWLPPGYDSQPAWAFRDRTGAYYEFNRVYAPPRHDEREPLGRLDEGLSYWSVTWPAAADPADHRPTGAWISYARARALKRSRLTYARFSSLTQMRDQLPALLGPDRPEDEFR